MVSRDRGFWFGTERHAEWLPCPLVGADTTPQGWSADGTLLNGGGWALNSFGSHKRYQYEWPASSSPQAAQKLKSYRDGTYGRGLLYFLDPLIYGTNVLPAHWADPSMSVGGELPSLVPGIEPTAVPTSGGAALGLPIDSAYYPEGNPGLLDLDDSNSVFIPIPDDHTLFLGAIYSTPGWGDGDGVYYAEIPKSGGIGATGRITAQTPATNTLVTEQIDGANIAGVRIAVVSAGPITLTALIGRLIKASDIGNVGKMNRLTSGPWVGGQGHSGCRFVGTPTYVENSGIDGGRVGYAATFAEVGSWSLG